MSHTVEWEAKGIYRKFTNEISGEEIMDSNLELQAHPHFQDAEYIVNDFIEVTDFTLEAPDTKSLASVDEVASNEKVTFKVALVVTKAALVVLANSYCSYLKANQWECAIFETVDGARKWGTGS